MTLATLPAAPSTRRITRCARAATTADLDNGLAWYAAARALAATLAAATGHTLTVAAGVIAAYSPRTDWRTNVHWAHCHLDGQPAGGTRVMREQAARIIAGDDYRDVFATAHKVRNFTASILGDPDAVCVDSWAYELACGTRDGLTLLRNRAHYDTVADTYRRAARRLGADPVTVQALCWTAYRAARGRVDA